MKGAIDSHVIKKIYNHLIYFLGILIIICFIDRVNISFAALDMNKDLGLSATAFGFAASIYFISFVLFQVPNLLLLTKIGPKIWFSGLMIIWGIISSLMAFSHSAKYLYIMRFLLGIAEAGFVPGVYFYLKSWVPNRHIGHAYSLQTTAVALSAVIAAPISTALLYVNWLGAAGWRWMFFLEGLPAILFGIITYFYLPEKPTDANWLSRDEKEQLTHTLKEEEASITAKQNLNVMKMLVNGQVLLFCLFAFMLMGVFWGLYIWLPLMIKSVLGPSHFAVGLLVAAPFLLGCIAMVLNGKHSDYTQDIKWHLAIPCFIAAICLVACMLVQGYPWVIYILMATGTLALLCNVGLLWAKPARFLSGSAAAGFYGLIMAIGSLGGFLGPFLVGYIKDATMSYDTGLMILAIFSALAGVLALLTKE